MEVAVTPRTFYATNGYYIHDTPAVSQDVIRRAIEGMDRVRAGHYTTSKAPYPSPWNPGDDPNQLCKIEMPHWADEGIHELVSHPAIGEIAARVTGAKMIQAWWVQLLYKPTLTEGATPVVGWHQDRTYWDGWTPESELFTIWVAVSDVKSESGPMRFVPGSHQWGLQQESDFFDEDIDGQVAKIPVPVGAVWSEVESILPPGGFSMHHSLTYHASGANYETLPRRSFAIHVRTENSRPENDERAFLTEFIDDETLCPILYRE